MNELELLNQASLANRTTFYNRTLQAQTSRDRAQEQQVQIISYDPSLGGYNVKHPNGTVGFAKAISNSSNLHKGAYVSLVQPSATQTATIDTTPR
ncbi:MAG: hypothetical protein V7K47_07095 [Nostoc sp.]